jgi:PAS domain S-box-containing protein
LGEREITEQLLQLVNQSNSTAELVRAVTGLFQKQSGCAAIGIRLNEGDDFPYYETRGYSKEFIRLENSLCAVDAEGKAVRDSDGRALLECMCGDVIRGRIDPSKTYFTPNGSFWTNSTTEYLAGTTEAARLTRIRHHCNEAGYESLALIPLKAGVERLGLLQLNDPRKGMFSAESIASWERLADQLAVALAKTRAEEAVTRLASFPQMNPNPVVEVDLEGCVSFVNPTAQRLFPDLQHRGPGHPWLVDWAALAAACREGSHEFPAREIKIDGRWYHQAIHFVAEARIRIYGFDITARKEVEAERERLLHEVRLSEQRLSWALQAGPGGAWDWDLSSGRAWWSPEMYGLWGVAPGTPITMENSMSIVDARDRERVRIIVEEAIASHTEPRYEFRITHAARGERWMATSARTLYDDADRAVRMLGITLDVTERKQAEQLLRDSQRDLNRAQAVARTGSWRMDLLRNELFWSDETYRIFGIPRSTPMTYESFLASVHPEDREHVDRSWRKALTGDPYDIEHRILVGGQVKWVRERAELEFDSHQRVLGGFGTVQDISERKEAEELLRQRAEELETLMDVVPAAIWVAHDPHCHSITGNRLANKFYEAGVGENVSAVPGPDEPVPTRRFFHLGVELPAHELPMQKAAAHDLEIRNAELDVLLPSGKWISMLGSASPLRDSEGRVRGCLGAFLDITKRKRAEEALRRAAEDLARSNEDLAQFAYVASHDLQEPLRAVSGFLQLLQSRYQSQLDDRAREYIRYSIEGAKRMSALISDLLAYSRIERRGRERETVEADSAVATALADLRASIEESGAQITRDDLPAVCADPTELAQLFQNLIGNAIKFRKSAGPCVIHISSTRQENVTVFSVRDNGIGIPRDQHERIFVIFQRLHTQQEHPGTGIGLAICKRIVDRHGGRIWVESTPGQGSEFFFTLGSGQVK